MPTATYSVTAFYHFCKIEDPTQLRKNLLAKAESLGIRGLILVAKEGINGTVSGLPEQIKLYKMFIRKYVPEVEFKDSYAKQNPCKRLFVKVKPEIVQLGKPEIVPDGPHNHLTPAQWNQMIETEDVVVLDARNTYETEVGMFKDAIDPGLEKFSDFPQWVADCNLPKEKPVMMYCTGGIRCEKAALEMEKQGYKHVYQLEGGILRYLEKCPHKHYQGECFVFDHRAAVDQELKPSAKYKLCPHCGDCGDQIVTCKHCDKECIVCAKCLKNDKNTQACSKNCANIMRGLIGKGRPK